MTASTNGTTVASHRTKKRRWGDRSITVSILLLLLLSTTVSFPTTRTTIRAAPTIAVDTVTTTIKRSTASISTSTSTVWNSGGRRRRRPKSAADCRTTSGFLQLQLRQRSTECESHNNHRIVNPSLSRLNARRIVGSNSDDCNDDDDDNDDDDGDEEMRTPHQNPTKTTNINHPHHTDNGAAPTVSQPSQRRLPVPPSLFHRRRRQIIGSIASTIVSAAWSGEAHAATATTVEIGIEPRECRNGAILAGALCVSIVRIWMLEID